MQKKKILLIDDEKDLISLIKMNLEKTEKFEVLLAHDGLTGVKLAKEHKPDFIFCDILMPGMPCSDVARNLTENRKTKNIPLIFLTALATREEIMGGRGPDGGLYMSKPVTTEDIIAFIEFFNKE